MVYQKRFKQPKYRNKKVEVDGIVFDSMREAKRYKELSMLLRAGKISDLKLQVPFILIEKYRNGEGKAIRKMEYIADFVYKQDGKTVVEDTKGFRTKEYRIKKKLFEHKYYPTTIREV